MRAWERLIPFVLSHRLSLQKTLSLIKTSNVGKGRDGRWKIRGEGRFCR